MTSAEKIKGKSRRLAFVVWGGFGGFFVAVDQVAEVFAGFEVGDSFGGDVHFGPRLWVAADAWVALAGAEAAEAADFDFVAASEGSDDGLENGFHDHFSVAAGQVAEFGYFFHEVCFGHGVLRKYRT